MLSLLIAAQCLFTPPSGWEIAQLKKPSPHVKIGFIGKGSTDYRPAINLSTEEVDVSLKEYVKAVKELQTSDGKTTWRDLGKIVMKAGDGRLIEMTQASPWGERKVLQAFFVQGNTAYILTASVLKDDMAKLQGDLFKSFQSLALVEDPFLSIKDLLSSLGKGEKEAEWKKVQADISPMTDHGPYWQFLALQEAYRKIYGVNL